MERSGKAAGIRQIAEMLGTSIGTVDRALHNRAGVNKETRHRVLQAAEQLGYRPNLAARSLKLNRTLRIASVLPQEIACFFAPLAAGVRSAAADSLSAEVVLDTYSYPSINSGEETLLHEVGAKGYDGILFTPGRPREMQGLIQNLSDSGIAMVCVGCDAPESTRAGSVTADGYTCGAIAAELFSYKLQRPARVVNITGELANFDHAQKLRGFAATLATLAPHLSLLPVVESHESPDIAYQQTLALLDTGDTPDAIYISTANSPPVLRALAQKQLLGRIQVITTDLFHELIPLIDSGQVLASLYQRPFSQGRLAFENLLSLLVRRSGNAGQHSLAPHVILRSNVALFLPRLSHVPRAAAEPAANARPARNGSRSRRPAPATA